MSDELIAINTPDGVADAYVTTPDDVPGPMPGVLFIVDAIGLRPQTKTMADRIASWGYVVLVPNVFYRDGTAPSLEPIGDLTEPENRATFMSEAMSRVKALTADLAERDLSAYIDALRGRDDVRHSDIGVTGYCMGGRLALLAAATRPDAVGAIGMFHIGGLVTDDPDSPHHLLPKVRADVLAIHAADGRRHVRARTHLERGEPFGMGSCRRPPRVHHGRHGRVSPGSGRGALRATPRAVHSHASLTCRRGRSPALQAPLPPTNRAELHASSRRADDS